MSAARGFVSKIPSFNLTGLDLSGIPGPPDNKENHEMPTQSEPSSKKMRYTTTSTPKADPSTFKAPKALGTRQKVGTTFAAPSRARAQPSTRRATTAPLAAQNKKAATVAPASSTTTGPPKQATKRAAWDVKGRLADLEAKYSELTNKNVEKTWECQQKETAVVDLQHDLLRYKEDTNVKDKVIADQGARLLAQEVEIRFLKTRNQTLETDLSGREKQCEEQTKELRDNNLHMRRMNFEIAAKDAELERYKHQNQNLEAANARLEQSCNEATAKAAEYEKLLDACETERKRQHNTILELKGNIRVFCRVRPLLPCEVSTSDVIDFVPDGRSLSIIKPLEPNETNARNRLKTDFKFDKVFNPSASQEIIFDEISQLVQSALDGYNVCIFAYGQTGSGKTYTMEGPAQITDFVSESDSPVLGMIPRAVTQVFSTARALSDRGWEYTMDVSILEIYNEILKDLLCTGAKNTQLSLNKGTDCAMAATTTTRVNCEKDVYTLLKHARKNRAVAATSCNEYSSRSHCIFRLKMVGRNEKTDETCEGTLSLVDLAGSERLKEMSLDGMRLRETKNINKSLSNLGNVILALAQKADHIPYRNSKLTQVLMNSLGGNSKTLMFINISPMEGSYLESINSLRFGTKVNSCNIGTASKVVK